MSIWNELVAAIGPTFTTWAFVFAFMTALELLLARGASQPLSARVPGLIFWTIWLPVSALVYHCYDLLWAALGIRPLIVLPLHFGWAGVLATVAAPLAGAAVHDFFFYWCHRAQHRWLWRFHRVHHSIRDLSMVNSYHHITEPVIQTLLILLPMSLISSDLGPALPIVAGLIYLQGSLIHSPTRFHLGPLRALFADNSFHRIHHSLEAHHFDRNYGAFTSVWDGLFGTAYFPARDEWPDVGLAGIDQPRNVGQWLTLPFRPAREPGPAPSLGALEFPTSH